MPDKISLLALWLPTLVSAVIAFFAAFIAWTVLPHHRSDWLRIPDEGRLLDVLRQLGLERGQYVFPSVMTPEGAKDPDAAAKMKEGPVGSLIIRPAPNLRKSLLQYFLFTLAVSFMAGYVAYATIPRGAEYLQVFRVVGTVAFLAYSAAEVPGAIWFGRTWSSTWKSVIDGLFFGLLTGGAFGWLWPR